MASAVTRSMSVFKAFIRPPVRLPVPAAVRPAKPTLVMILPVVVRCIVGTIPYYEKELLRALDAALQEHTQLQTYGILVHWRDADRQNRAVV
jgi:hypothetical protein